MTFAAQHEDWQNAGFGIYIHWPFCLAKCPYCDFNSHISRDVDQQAWQSALVQSLRFERERIGHRTVNTIFFGGGTPSLMPAQTVARLIETIDQLWGIAPKAEISLEANPTSVEAQRFKAYALAGVNRLSMGIQALNDRDLRALGRQHSVAEAKAAFALARQYFESVSFDLIYARQSQTLQDWEAELSQALEMAVDHLSLYQLTIETGTRFGALYQRGKLRHLPDDQRAADLYDLTRTLCEAKGMPAYEVSNHARLGAQSQHNLLYWRYGDYVGVGPGAHGRITLSGQKQATEAVKSPASWLANPVSKIVETISRHEQAQEYLMMAARLQEGVDLKRYTALSGVPLKANLLAEFVNEGLLHANSNRLWVTAKGRMILNHIILKLLSD